MPKRGYQRSKNSKADQKLKQKTKVDVLAKVLDSPFKMFILVVLVISSSIMVMVSGQFWQNLDNNQEDSYQLKKDNLTVIDPNPSLTRNYREKVKVLVPEYLAKRVRWEVNLQTAAETREPSFSPAILIEWRQAAKELRQQLLQETVPVFYRNLHLSLVVILTQEEKLLNDLITQGDKKEAAGQAKLVLTKTQQADLTKLASRWSKIVADYDWLNL